MITIEKALILRSVEIFSSLSDEKLAFVAPLLVEMYFSKGDAIIRRDELSSQMYIIVEGEVQVQVNQRVLATLHQRDVFGEFSALDPERRTADVIATKECLLLQLDHQALKDVMEQHPEIAFGIIRFLCKRLRSIVAAKN